MDVGVGLYVRPIDVTDDPDHTHKLEGTVWAVERLPDPKTGQVIDWAHVVRVWQGDLAFNMLESERVGTATPVDPITIDTLIKVAARLLVKQGRRAERRLFALINACGFMLSLPQILNDVPSIYGDVPETTVEEVFSPGAVADNNEQVSRFVARLDSLDSTAVNELRRDARNRGLAYLELGAVLKLGELVTYDAMLRRWEKHAARAKAAS